MPGPLTAQRPHAPSAELRQNLPLWRSSAEANFIADRRHIRDLLAHEPT
jgi:hypothetical protein